MAKPNHQMEIPSNAEDLMALAKRILARDATLAGKSPARKIKGWARFPDALATAEKQHKASNTLYRQAVEAREIRDVVLGHVGPTKPHTVRHFVTAMHNQLWQHDGNREELLREWGFDIPTSSAKS